MNRVHADLRREVRPPRHAFYPRVVVGMQFWIEMDLRGTLVARNVLEIIGCLHRRRQTSAACRSEPTWSTTCGVDGIGRSIHDHNRSDRCSAGRSPMRPRPSATRTAPQGRLPRRPSCPGPGTTDRTTSGRAWLPGWSRLPCFPRPPLFARQARLRRTPPGLRPLRGPRRQSHDDQRQAAVPRSAAVPDAATVAARALLPLAMVRFWPSMVVSALMVLALVTVMVAAPRVEGYFATARARAEFSAASVQLLAVPIQGRHGRAPAAVTMLPRRTARQACEPPRGNI